MTKMTPGPVMVAGGDAMGIGDDVRLLAGQHQTRLNIKEALVPPNPKLLESATSILRCLATSGTRSMSQPSDGSCRLSVGGATLSRIASSEKIASTAPAAPSRWPMADLVEDMESV